MILIGVTQHSPWHLQEVLQTKGLGMSSYVAEVDKPINLDKVNSASVLILPSFPLLVRNLKMLNSSAVMRDKPVLLFASVLRLCEVEGCYALDYEPRDGLRYKFKAFSTLDLKRILRSEPLEVSLTHKKLIPQLVDSVQKGSFLSPLMTLLYQLPASQQTALRTALLTWMISAKPSDDLKKLLTRSRLPDTIKFALYKHMTSPLSLRYRAALAAIRKAPKATGADYAKLAAEHQTIKYELRYILKSLKQDDGYREMDGMRLDALWQKRYGAK